MLGDYESSGSFVFSLLPQIVCAVEIKLTVRYPWPETRSLLLLVVAHGQLGARRIDITMKTRLTLETESVLFQCVFMWACVHESSRQTPQKKTTQFLNKCASSSTSRCSTPSCVGRYPSRLGAPQWESCFDFQARPRGFQGIWRIPSSFVDTHEQLPWKQ